MSDLKITLIDQTDNVDDLKRRESFQKYEMDIFQQNGLSERSVTLFWCVYLFKFYTFFIFSGLHHYIYCSTLISTIILNTLIFLTYSLIVVIIIVIITIIILFYLLISFTIYLFIYLFYFFIDTWTCPARG